MNEISLENNDDILFLEQKTGHVYIFEIEENNIIAAILLHDAPFKIRQNNDLKKTSLVKLKMVSEKIRNQALSIQAALRNCESVHAQVIFKNLKLLENEQNGVPNTSAELTDIIELVVKYR